jgi:hypothetical protein
MERAMSMLQRGKAITMVLAILIVGALTIAWRAHQKQTPEMGGNIPVSAPATAPTSVPTARVAATQPQPRDLLGLVRTNDRNYPTTQELETPASYDQAAHLVFHQPVYLCAMGHEWITDARGQSIASILANPGDGNCHIVTETIVFIHWQVADNGKWIATAVAKNKDGRFDLVSANRTTPLSPNRSWQWDRALAWDDKIVVPTDRGVSIFSVNDPSKESYQALVDEVVTQDFSTPVALFDAIGVVAWMPWEFGKAGSRGAARFADGKWTHLDSTQGWGDKILQLIPLLDGSVLQLIPNDDGSMQLQMSGIARDSTKVDEPQVQKLVEQLSDPDQTNRDAAYEQLTRYGPGVFPILQKLQDNQPPAAQGRIAELLKSEMKLTLGPITLQPGEVKVVQRLHDGGVVLYCDAGVSVARGSDVHPVLVAPAWLSIRPGYPVQVLSTRMTQDFTPGKQRFFAFKSEWIIGDQTQGLRWFVGNYFSPLQHKDELRFSEFVCIDSRGRWIMKTPGDSPSTLIVDPNLPDPTPRLPVWIYTQADGPVGWTNTNWPAVKPNGVIVLDAGAWRDPAKDEVFYEHEGDMPKAASTTVATTGPATGPATTQESADLILADTDGTHYYDGSSTIRIRTRDGTETTWNLPSSACGNGDVWFFHCGDDRYFLFNQPGRVLRLRRTPDGPEPFVLEATFTHNIPNVDGGNTWIDRIWLDPAGRLVMSCSGKTLAIMFPSGRVPPEIQQMMPPEKEDQ